jgi:predicted  nucleic acid-binding Zn-ribbon protein
MNKETKTLEELKEELEKLNVKKEFVKKALKMIDNQRSALHMRICTHEKF